MQELEDITLLRQFAASRSEAAFEQLVSRHAGFVHSAALRQVRDPQLAAEITQAVFLILARKAAGLSDKTILTGWLCKTTRFVALAQVRAEVKRRQHEQETQMHTQLQTEPSSDAGDQAWSELAPLLDQALAHLGETDRQAVLLRFFENKSLAEVGHKLGAGEDTARKRVSRALEKLRKFFAKRGAFYTTAIIAAAISANAVQAAPPGLVAAIPAMALKGSAISVSTLTLVKEALHLMTIAKIKTAALIGAAAIVAASGTVLVGRVVAQDQTPRQQPTRASQPATGNQLAANVAGQPNNPPPLSDDEVHEMARLRNELGRLRVQDAQLRKFTNFLAKAEATTNPPEIGETVWFINSSNELMALPPAFILRPTHFKPLGGGGGGPPAAGLEIGEGTAFFARRASVESNFENIPTLARNISLNQLMAKAYGVNLEDVVTPDDAPKGHFDLLMTGPDATKERLQAEIKSRLGYTAHVESPPTDVLVLTTNPTNAPRLHLAAEDAGRSGAGGAGGRSGRGGGGTFNMSEHDGSIPTLIKQLNLFFQLPIIDRTGLTGTYDFDLKVEYGPDTTRDDAVMQAMPGQLGLVLTPDTAPYDQLIVEADEPPVSPAESENTNAMTAAVPKVYAAPTVQDLDRLRAEKATLVADMAGLKKSTDAMSSALVGKDPLVIDEYVWSINNTGATAMLPPAFILRPTQYAGERKAKFGIKTKRERPGPIFDRPGATTNENNPIQVLAADITFGDLMATAYDMNQYKLVMPAGAPTNGFDLLMTGADATRARLQAEIKSQLGYTAHTESRPTNVLLLTVHEAGAAGLQVSQSTNRGSSGSYAGLERHFKNVLLPDFVKDLQRSFDMPIFDRTGLTNRFDISLSVASPQDDAIKQALIEQLGLQLKTGVEPIELLVVEADKSN